MPPVIDDALCIRVWDWSETSQTALLFARERGMVRGLAKGSKRAKGAFCGGLEPITRGELGVILKPGSELATLTSWDLREVFPAVRRSLAAFYAAMYMAELVQWGLTDRDPHPGVWEALAGALRGLDGVAAEASLGVVVRFQWSLLDEAGYKPEIQADVRGAALAPAGVYAFVPELGGFVADGAEQAGLEVWRVRSETLALLRMVSLGGAAGAEPSGPATIERAVRFLNAYAEYVLGRALASSGPMLAAALRALTG